MRSVRGKALAWAACLASAMACARSDPDLVTVYAAASTREAIEAVLASSPVRTRLNVAATSVLARQIESGAPADLFVAADDRWMSHLDDRGRLQAGTRRILFTGRLVVVRPKQPNDGPTGAPPDDAEPGWPSFERIALADPAHVPAGRYARRALEAAGQWAAIEPKVVAAADVRGALTLVARGQVDLAVVYATDLRLSEAVEWVADLPLPEGEMVVYPVAAVAGRHDAKSQAVLQHLTSSRARMIYDRFGFGAPPQ